MLKVIVSLCILTTSIAFAYGPVRIYPGSSKPSTHRYAYPTNYNSNIERFYGQNMGGSFSSLPEDYIHTLTYCRGLSTNLDKMMSRTIYNTRKEILRRLDCANKGLAVDLATYKLDNRTLFEIAQNANNEIILEYLKNL